MAACRFAPMVFTFGPEWCSASLRMLFSLAGIPKPDSDCHSLFNLISRVCRCQAIKL
jgi:hypothetical protein